MSLESIDARLERIERELRQSLPGSRRHRHSQNRQRIGKVARTSFSARASEVEPHQSSSQVPIGAPRIHSSTSFRLIKPGFLLYEDGETKVNLVGLEDAKFVQADTNSQLQMIEYLKNLRLVLWLFKQQNYLAYTQHALARVPKSFLVLQASLTSKCLRSSIGNPLKRSNYDSVLDGEHRVRDIYVCIAVGWEWDGCISLSLAICSFYGRRSPPSNVEKSIPN